MFSPQDNMTSSMPCRVGFQPQYQPQLRPQYKQHQPQLQHVQGHKNKMQTSQKSLKLNVKCRRNEQVAPPMKSVVIQRHTLPKVNPNVVRL